MPREEAYLVEVNRSIAASSERVSDQKKRLAELQRKRRDTEEAEKVLATLIFALRTMIDRRHQLIVALGKQRSIDRRAL